MMALHRRLAALLALVSLLAFVSGAGLDAPSVVPAGIVLLLAVFVQPDERWARYFEPLWRIAAIVLAGRAGLRVLTGVGDPVLPMVDLLLLLLCAESLRARDGSGDARHFALTFALLIASAAYRPGPLFGVLFVAYVVCATVVLVVGHLTREADAHGVTGPPPQRAFLLRIAALSGVVLGVSAAVFLFFPRVSEGWAARATPMVTRAVVGFSDRIVLGYHGARIEPNPEVVLRIEFPGGAPHDLASLHWRGRSYNRFDGVSWSRFDQPGPRVNEAELWPGPVVEQVIYARPLGDANVLFGLHPILDVTPLSRIQPVRMRGGDFLYTGDAEPVYSVRSRAGRPDPAALRQVQPATTREVVSNLQVPGITARMVRLADSLRASAPTMYDHVRAVERYLRQFDYSLDLPATRRDASLDHFLFVRRAGHCEYFSTAMAILLRAGGVATRNVNGFLGGDWNEFGQYLSVTQNNAHSWVEVYFPGHGWVAFDPTPPGAASTIAGGVHVPNRFRMFLDGFEHRWNKWVLDYDPDRQSSLLQRASPLGGGGAVTGDGGSGLFWPLLVTILLGAGVLLAVRRLRGARAARPAVTRAYLGVRRAYERIGYPAAPALPPLAFASAVRDAPGAADARRVVELYVRTRFGGTTLSTAEAEALRTAAAAARAAVRGAGGRSTGERCSGIRPA
jgi:protein-glutamine gamma-glutamyltransferase